MVDLGKFQQIQAFDLVFEYEVLPTLEDAQAATTPVYGQAWQYKIEGSNDKSSWDMLWDNTANTDFSKEQYGKIAEEYANNKYQYVRVTLTQLPLHKESRATVWPAIGEVKVLGEEVINPEEEKKVVLTEKGQNIDIDLAYSQPVKVSSSKDGENVTDRDANTTWAPNADDENPSLTIGLDREYNIENFSVDFDGEATPYTVMVNTSKGWVEAGSCDSKDSGNVVSVSKNEITGIKFQFEKGMTAKVSEVHFDGVDAKVKHHKRILVMAPHEDDEMLMAGGVMNRAVANGDEVYVVYATNGDYNGVDHGKLRISDTVNALNTIGVPTEHLYFLGYADNGGMGVGAFTTAFTDSFVWAEWATKNEGAGAWLSLAYDEVQKVTKIKIYDRPNTDDHITNSHLEFDDGTTLEVGELPNDGSVKEISLGEGKEVKNIKFVVDEVSESTTAVGLAEIEVIK